MVNKKNHFFLILFLGLVQLLSAQHGTLSGRVVDDSTNAIPFVIIQIVGTSHITTADQEGRFFINKLQEGNYQVLVTSFSIDTTRTEVVIESGKNTSIIIKSSYAVNELPEVVCTATRTDKDINSLPIPVKVIDKSQIMNMGSARLNEVLAEQTGLAIINDHGTGIQMQGLNSEYTLILLNGEPLVGRTAGTFDLTRIAVGNIQRIEVVKGPSSSLYGSEALAGVINIITDKPKERFSGSFKSRYASNNTLGLTADLNLVMGKSKLSLFADRYSSSGYYLSSAEDKTVPPFQNYTLQANYSYKFNPRLLFSLSGKYFIQNQISTFSVVEPSETFRISDEGQQNDWNINPTLTYFLSEKDKITARSYSTFYHTQSLMSKMSDGSIYDDSYFNQFFNREELQYDRSWNSKQHTIAGAGVLLESVNSTRYTEKQNFNSLYFYLQHDITLFKNMDIIAGARLDRHSVYGSQLSPKLSASYKVNKYLSFRGSVGRGFKAPDFRQLYLNFTNPVEGYTVLGTQEIAFQLEQMQQQGLISQYLVDPASLQTLKAEQSTAYNVGWVLKPLSKFTWQVNFFRNDISNMIATMGIAVKTNNQTVFSYSNLYSVYTEGIETDFDFKLHKNFIIAAGYQYLIAKDKQVLSDIDKGLYYSKDPQTWVTTKISKEDYGGLFNRSKHMANLRLFYSNQKSGWSASIRGIYRGKYGFNDANGNLILDADNEYVNGYIIWNVSLSKRIMRNVVLQGGIDNITGYTNPQYISSIPGRVYFGSLTIPLTKETFKSIK